MANSDRANGFTPVKHLNGSAYNGQSNIYECAAGETIPVFVGDLVILSDADATSVYPVCEAGVEAADVNAVYIGAVVGVFPVGYEPVTDNFLSNSEVTLIPNYRRASTKQFVLVSDAQDIIYEAQADAAVALASISLNAGVVQGTGSASLGNTASGRSGMEVDGGSVAVTATLPLQVMGFPNRPDNEPAATDNKVLVRINTQAYGNVGVLGI
jgi:hypothetical protein